MFNVFLRCKKSNTVERLNNGHVGEKHFVHCLEVVPSSEVEMYGQYIGRGKTIVGRLSTLQSVHYQRFHCIREREEGKATTQYLHLGEGT